MSDEVILSASICVPFSLRDPQGASPRELLLEAARRNNTALLSEILASQSSPAQISHLLNTATDGVGEYCLHLAATYGSCMPLSLSAGGAS